MMNLTIANEERYVLWIDWKNKRNRRSYVIQSPVVSASVSEHRYCEECEQQVPYVAETTIGCLCIPCLNEEYKGDNSDDDDEEQQESAKQTEQVHTAPDSVTTASVSEPSSKLFEYVTSNELYVVFKQKGVQVVVGWSSTDKKPYVMVGNNTPKAQMVQSSIDAFKQFKNGVHGDIARIVKALTRVRKMPECLLGQGRQERKQQTEMTNKTNQPRQKTVERKENTTVTRYSGTVDASWLGEFRNVFFSTQKRQPTGYEIRDAWVKRGA